MSKFKVGDMVVIIDTASHYFKIGDVVRVVQTATKWRNAGMWECKHRDEGYGQLVHESQIIPYQVHKLNEEAEELFK